MYHRFDESKYPSTIQLDIFKKHLEIIENEGIKFIHPHELKSLVEKERKILFTVDDGLLSFMKCLANLKEKNTYDFICKYRELVLLIILIGSKFESFIMMRM